MLRVVRIYGTVALRCGGDEPARSAVLRPVLLVFVHDPPSALSVVIHRPPAGVGAGWLRPAGSASGRAPGLTPGRAANLTSDLGCRAAAGGDPLSARPAGADDAASLQRRRRTAEPAADRPPFHDY